MVLKREGEKINECGKERKENRSRKEISIEFE